MTSFKTSQCYYVLKFVNKQKTRQQKKRRKEYINS